MWYDISASNGNKTGENNRNTLAILMTQSQIEEAQRLAMDSEGVLERLCESVG